MSSSSPSELSSERASLLRDAIIDSLHPPKSTDDREAQVPASYARTFEWIFEGDFGAWLSNEEAVLTSNGRLYWINGLPGSGKSTLLRFIHQNSRLTQALKRWGSKTEIASFFFWESGTVLQRSQEGFLRSILSQLLTNRLGLIPSVFPDLWSKIWGCDTAERVRTLQEWPIERLAQGVATYFTLSQRPDTLLLIDGLDELEGDPTVVLDLLSQISQCEHVKLCISSRPYSIFDSWFKNVSSMRLQDLTSGDIEKFIRGRLAEHRHLEKIGQQEQEALVQGIQAKAQGVFLWAAVAMDILEETDDPLKQLDILPSSLNDVYRYRLVETGPLPAELSLILQLLRARQDVSAFTRVDDTSVMTLRELSIAFQDLDALDVEISKADSSGVTKQCQKVAKTLQLASRGLLLVQKGQGALPDRMINYKHRTVKDWLADKDTWKEIQALAPPLDPHLIHLNTTLILFKSPLEKPRRARNVNAWWPHLVLCFTHARFSPSDTFDLLIDLDDTMSWYWISMEKDVRLDSWARSCFGTLESRGRGLWEDPFLALAIRFGVISFVKRYLEEGLYEVGDGKSVLDQAVAFLVNRQSTLYPLSNPKLVNLLLDFGLDVNRHMTGKKGGKTPWEQVLESIQQADRRKWIDTTLEDTKRWTGIAQDFLSRGADKGATAHFGWKDKPESAKDLMKRIAQAYPNNDISRLYDAI